MTPADFAVLIRDNRKRRPKLFRVLRKDGVQFAGMRHERFVFGSKRGEWMNALRVPWKADDYLGVAFYRLRTAIHGWPILPALLHRASIVGFGIRIGEHV